MNLREEQPPQLHRSRSESMDGKKFSIPLIDRPITTKEMIGLEAGLFTMILLLLLIKKPSR